MKYKIVASKFNDDLMKGLIDNTIASLLDSGVMEKDIDVVRVPGAYEIPQAINFIQRVSLSATIDAKIPSVQRVYIALGVVIEGETNHAQMIIETTGKALLDISANYGFFVINEIVGAPSYEIAKARCIGKENTRGWYAGKAAVEVAEEMKKFAFNNF